MIQRFILLGEGYNDLYELLELASSNQSRIHMLLRLDTTINDQEKSSLVLILHPAVPGKMMPLYLCLEGINSPNRKQTERYRLFEQLSKQVDKPIHKLEVKSSDQFEEKDLYYQYLIGVLRMNRYIPPLQ
ncbi:methylthioribose kinase [Halalkalibacter kiskunsagensis]|uniref:Methylthioribose kinase n=1 Tax=Halalkalibacter kiskunsagensis TaxID=1548599 RepID=A0ABV6KMJ6_9BACI